jgi:hypothetical protein
MVFIFLGRKRGWMFSLFLAWWMMAGAAAVYAEDKIPPAIQVSPVNGANDVSVDCTVSVTFGESVKMADGTSITSHKARSLFVLSRQEDDENVEVSVSWSEKQKRLTITPRKPFDFGTSYQLKIPAGKVTDRAGNRNQALQVTFQTEEAGPPLAVYIQPEDQTANVPVDSQIRIMFNKRVKRANKAEITNDAIGKIVKINDSKGKRIDFSGSWDTDRKTITLDPAGNLNSGTAYTVTLLENKIMDSQGVKNPQVTSRFTTKQAEDTIPPSVTTYPAHGSVNVPLVPKITLQFAEDVQFLDGTPLSSKTVNGIVLFHNDKGEYVDYSATWNKSKRTMTIKAKGSLQNYTTYTLILPANVVKDRSGNSNKQLTVTFTTGNR